MKMVIFDKEKKPVEGTNKALLVGAALWLAASLGNVFPDYTALSMGQDVIGLAVEHFVEDSCPEGE